jgi:hypothetical protein
VSIREKTCTGCGQSHPLDDYQRDARSSDGRRSRCSECRRPIPPELRAQKGLSPSQRAALDAGAKQVAMRFTWAVKARHAAEIQRIAAGMSREELAALAIVLAEAVRPGDMRLQEVTRVPGSGLPEGVTRRPVPAAVRVAETAAALTAESRALALPGAVSDDLEASGAA